jgi:hypothetical protein
MPVVLPRGKGLRGKARAYAALRQYGAMAAQCDKRRDRLRPKSYDRP